MSLKKSFINQILTAVERYIKPGVSSSVFQDFTVSKPLPMKIDFYVDHFLYQLTASESILVLAYMLLENILHEITQNNVHKIVLTSLVLAYKFLVDVPVPNSQLEKIDKKEIIFFSFLFSTQTEIYCFNV